MTKKRFSYLQRALILALASGLICVSPVAAGTINIQLTGQGILYDGGDEVIHDTQGAAGGSLNPLNADILSTAAFSLDGVTVDVRTLGDGGGPLYGDLLIDNAGSSIPLNVLTTVGGGGPAFGFDLFTVPNNDIPLLRLDLDEVELLINGGTAFFYGDATVVAENLPAGLSFGVGNTVAISYTAAQPSVNTGMRTTSMFAANGTFNISGENIIPEPAAMLLAMVGLVALSLRWLRARDSLG